MALKAPVASVNCFVVLVELLTKSNPCHHKLNFDDLKQYGSELKVKEAGKLRIEGKEYIMQDGDICHFRFNV